MRGLFLAAKTEKSKENDSNYDLYLRRANERMPCFGIQKCARKFGRSGCDKQRGRGRQSAPVDTLQITPVGFIIFGAFLSPVQIGRARSHAAWPSSSLWSDLLFDSSMFLAQQENHATATNPTLTCCDNGIRARETTKSEIHLCNCSAVMFVSCQRRRRRFLARP